jgi:predicted extracellular nuclease
LARIQGRSHQSPYQGKEVTAEGIVTRVHDNGFIIQSKSADASPDTSEAIYIYQKETEVLLGNELQITGVVEEWIPGGENSYNQPLTQIRVDKLRRIRSKAPLPKPVVLNDLFSDFPKAIKLPGSKFDTALNALDFWESMEHMRVVLMDATVMEPKTKYGEMVVRIPQGQAEPATARGGVKLTAYDFNPARILVALTPGNEHTYNTGDRIQETIHGHLTYSYGNYKIGVSKALSAPVEPANSFHQNRPDIPDSSFKIATFNVENLYTELPNGKFEAIAHIITESLQAPDIIALQEIHDNSGPTNDNTVDACEVINKLLEAIEKAGGPRYSYLQLNPENNADGGWPGANIRNAYLFRDSISLGQSYLLQDPAFDRNKDSNYSGTRKPLVAFFTHGDEKLIFINCHLISKGGDSSTYGSLLPAIRFSDTQRVAQTRVLRKHINKLQIDHPDASIVVLGDINDFEFSSAVKNLTRDNGLVNLVDSVPLADRYTYIFQGFSQVLDHILVSPSLASRLSTHIAHVNSDRSEGLRSSDHDPILAWTTIED